MRGRLLRQALAAAIVVTVALPVAVRPAGANPNADYRGATVALLISLWDKASDGAVTPLEIAQLVQELVTGVNGVKSDVVNRLDSELVHTLQGKVRTATTSVHYLNNPVLRGPYILLVNEAAFQADTHLDTVSADDDLDAVGRAMMVLFTTLLIAEQKAGAIQPSRYVDYREALEHLIDRMHPDCSAGGMPNHAYVTYTCEFNGETVTGAQQGMPPFTEYSLDGGPWVPGTLDRAAIQEMAMSESVEKLAKEALAALCTEHPEACPPR